jgi:hypothetical protein
MKADAPIFRGIRFLFFHEAQRGLYAGYYIAMYKKRQDRHLPVLILKPSEFVSCPCGGNLSCFFAGFVSFRYRDVKVAGILRK